MEDKAKTTVTCDYCKTPLRADDPNGSEAIEATLNNKMGEEVDFQFCDEECLRVFLNNRKKKTTSATFRLTFSLNLGLVDGKVTGFGCKPDSFGTSGRDTHIIQF